MPEEHYVKPEEHYVKPVSGASSPRDCWKMAAKSDGRLYSGVWDDMRFKSLVLMAGMATLWLLFLLLRMTWSSEKPLRFNGTGHHNKGRGTDRKQSCFTVSLGDPAAQTYDVIKVYNRLPTVFLPNHVYTELEDVPTLYHKEGFWSMLMLFLPSGFWMGQALSQRLLWEVGGVVGLIPKWDSYQQFLNRTTNTSRVLKSLLKDVVDPWDCKIGSTAFQCIRELSRHLLDHTVMTSEDRGLIQAWLTDLEVAGYKEPKRANHEFHCQSTLIATSGLIRPLLISAGQPSTSDLSTVINTLCPQLMYSDSPAPVITDVALIITFNSDKFYGNLPLLEAIHRRYFAHIIYCGPRQDRFKAKLTASIASSNILFIEGLKEGWHFMWECLTLTSKFNLNVRGYLQIGDDTLLNSWNIADLPRDRIWIVHHGQLIRRDEERNGWVWWKRASGQKAVNRALDTVVRTNSKEPGNIHVSNFLKTYTANVGDISHVYQASSDLMYIPSKMADQFRYLADVFRRERVIVELTYPTLIHGLAPSADIYVIQEGIKEKLHTVDINDVPDRPASQCSDGETVLIT
ncbi:uncharacterized protein [Haliotis asinina]|uniref:uncharacterized protein n=1 Tax=Haliotis asinina TaxID=109174 RepID=UPI003531D41E